MRPWRLEYLVDPYRRPEKWRCSGTFTTKERAESTLVNLKGYTRYSWRVRHRDAPVTK